MPLPPVLHNLALPVIGAPLFIISCPALVIAQCKAGVVGSFPALNAPCFAAYIAIKRPTDAAGRDRFAGNAIGGAGHFRPIVHPVTDDDLIQPFAADRRRPARRGWGRA